MSWFCSPQFRTSSHLFFSVLGRLLCVFLPGVGCLLARANAAAPDHSGAPTPLAAPSHHLPSLMPTTLPVRRIWACHRRSFRIGCPKASMKSPRTASRTPTRTRTNAARMPRPPVSEATALVSAAERPAGAGPDRRTARTACRPTTATARAFAPRMAGFARLA